MIARDDCVGDVTATKLPVSRFPRVFVLTSVIPTKSSRVPVHIMTLLIGAVALFVTLVIIFTKLSFAPSENIFWRVTRFPRIVNTREETILPCPTDFVVSAESTTKLE